MGSKNFKVKLESIFDQVDIPQIEAKADSGEKDEKEDTCSDAMLKVIGHLAGASEYSEGLLQVIIKDLAQYPKENFFASKL